MPQSLANKAIHVIRSTQHRVRVCGPMCAATRRRSRRGSAARKEMELQERCAWNGARCFALSGLRCHCDDRCPRALPWAVMFLPLRGEPSLFVVAGPLGLSFAHNTATRSCVPRVQGPHCRPWPGLRVRRFFENDNPGAKPAFISRSVSLSPSQFRGGILARWPRGTGADRLVAYLHGEHEPMPLPAIACMNTHRAFAHYVGWGGLT